MLLRTRRVLAVSAAFAVLPGALAACGSTPAPASPSSSAPLPKPSSSAPPTSPKVPDREPHTLVLNATGSGDITTIKYSLDGVEKQTGAVDLPWRESLTVAADGKPHQWTLEIDYSGVRTGGIDMFAVFDGKEAGRSGAGSAGSGNTHVSGNASVGGTVDG
ncbi:hypothetical protein OG943_11290 [Amycolatopsis sp. NBC_00345]|uniref:hypothetical protein n=1 Tax=Amycolatopsis sp. NBC_00345 TaxID=2975955 RepID=UPI002E25713A